LESEPFSAPILRSKVHWTWICSCCFYPFSGNGGVVFEPITPPANGNGLVIVQETIQDRASRRHVAQKFAHSSKGRLLVMMVDWFSYRRMITSKRCSPEFLGITITAITIMLAFTCGVPVEN
jgi:hypothetical protein